jgi:hypothetical protein
MPTPFSASTLREFLDTLQRVSVSSLYYHVFDARLRLGQNENDFSRWFRDLGLARLADDVARVDPYTHTLEGLRNTILARGKKYDTD